MQENMTQQEAIFDLLGKWLPKQRLPMPMDVEFEGLKPSPCSASRRYIARVEIDGREIECDAVETEPRVRLIGRMKGERIVMLFTMTVIQYGNVYRQNFVRECGFEVAPSEKAHSPSNVKW